MNDYTTDRPVTIPGEIMDALRNPRELAMWTILARHSHDGQTVMSRRALADRMGLASTSSLNRIIQSLTDKGFISVTPRWVDMDTGQVFTVPAKGRRQDANVYRVAGVA